MSFHYKEHFSLWLQQIYRMRGGLYFLSFLVLCFLLLAYLGVLVLHKSKLLVCSPELDRDVQGKSGRKGDLATACFLLTSRPADSHNVSALRDGAAPARCCMARRLVGTPPFSLKSLVWC